MVIRITRTYLTAKVAGFSKKLPNRIEKTIRNTSPVLKQQSLRKEPNLPCKYRRKGKCIMREITVTVDLKGKNYLTNVIADRETSEEEILEMARKQVQEQWLF
jgi:hypothetical protein